ncbi:unnamed protein product [Durusdinium trenchii]|uniref:VDE lipocalin domain-containing protein n=1 Tax=Durusdinium trenchii TaxID=1381693 RepID=A0ABP0QK54_9DINO
MPIRPWSAVADENLARVAPCLLSKCQLPLAKCILNPSCAADLTCVIACSGQPDESSCQINCGNNFENDVVVEFNRCALSAKKCVPQRPDKGPVPGEKNWEPIKGRYPPPPPDSVSDDFEVTKMTGRWYITAGLNPLFDTFDCQVHFFEGLTCCKICRSLSSLCRFGVVQRLKRIPQLNAYGMSFGKICEDDQSHDEGGIRTPASNLHNR